MALYLSPPLPYRRAMSKPPLFPLITLLAMASIGSAEEALSTVSVESAPAGATVWMDRKLFCSATPCSGSVKSGKHRFVVHREGFLSRERFVDVNEEPLAFMAELVRDHSTLRVETVPPGLPVFVDGKPIAEVLSGQRIAFGPHTVTARGSCEEGSERINITPGEDRTLQVVARPIVARFIVEVRDSGGKELHPEVRQGDRLLGPSWSELSAPVCPPEAFLQFEESVSWPFTLAMNGDSPQTIRFVMDQRDDSYMAMLQHDLFDDRTDVESVADRRERYKKACTDGDSIGCQLSTLPFLPPHRTMLDKSALWRSCEQGHLGSCFAFAATHFESEHGWALAAAKGDRDLLPRQVRMAARRVFNYGNESDGLLRGLALANGVGSDVDRPLSAEYLRASCSGGNYIACRIGFLEGLLGVRDEYSFYLSFDKKCRDGDAYACNVAADERFVSLALPFSGHYAPKDESFLKACEYGDVRACLAVAEGYRSGYTYCPVTGCMGNGCNTSCSKLAANKVKAVDYFNRACDWSEGRGCDGLAMVLETGNGVPKNPKRALALRQRSCGDGSPEGCLALATAHEKGAVLPKNLPEALRLRTQVCEWGFDTGCLALAAMYEKGLGVGKDAGKALGIRVKACEGGWSAACTDVGAMYESGAGVEKNAVRAWEFYSRARSDDPKAKAAINRLQKLQAEVLLESVPSGQPVVIDGKAQGTTPQRLLLVEGEHRARVGTGESAYAAREEAFAVVKGRKLKLEWRLEPQFGGLSVVAEPPGAKILLDGKEVGSSPLNLKRVAVGEHELEAMLNGQASPVKRVRIDANKDTQIRLEIPAADTRCPPGMVYISGGSFSMGARNGDPAAMPAHWVTVDDFCLDRTEHTAVDRMPMVDVDWKTAQLICAKEGKRLPTEAEWEWAARGEAGRTYPWGDSEPTCDRAVFQGCGCLSRVGRLPAGATPEGVQDLAGNAAEWTADCFEYYMGFSEKNPLRDSDSCDARVVRGGGFRSCLAGAPMDASGLRSYSRERRAPGSAAYDLGFRCARKP